MCEDGPMGGMGGMVAMVAMGAMGSMGVCVRHMHTYEPACIQHVQNMHAS